MQIRTITASDKTVWRALWTDYLTFYESTLPDEIYDVLWERLLSDAEYDPRGFLAWHDGQAVGLVHYYYHRTCWAIENLCYLQDLFVNSNIRGTGAGRALIEAVYKAADDVGCPDVYWVTQEHNETARKLYDRIARKTDRIKYQRT